MRKKQNYKAFVMSAHLNLPGTGLVTHRRVYHFSHVRVWALKVPPGLSPVVYHMFSRHLNT